MHGSLRTRAGGQGRASWQVSHLGVSCPSLGRGRGDGCFYQRSIEEGDGAFGRNPREIQRSQSWDDRHACPTGGLSEILGLALPAHVPLMLCPHTPGPFLPASPSLRLPSQGREYKAHSCPFLTTSVFSCRGERRFEKSARRDGGRSGRGPGCRPHDSGGGGLRAEAPGCSCGCTLRPVFPSPSARSGFEEGSTGPRKEHARSDSENWRSLREEQEEEEEGSWRLGAGPRRESDRWRSSSPGKAGMRAQSELGCSSGGVLLQPTSPLPRVLTFLWLLLLRWWPALCWLAGTWRAEAQV